MPVVSWQDNSQVTVASNMEQLPIVLGKTTAKRWLRVNKQKVDVPQPSIVNGYNHGMGGVDLF